MQASPRNARATDVDESREISATRVFDAPRELVWKMWSESRHIAQWWGPNGFTNTIHKMDFRPGGEWRFVMHGPDGTDYRNKFVFGEIVKPELITLSHTSGPIFDAIITFSDEGRGKTRVMWRMIFETSALREKVMRDFGAAEGLKQNVAKLGDYIERINPANGAFVITHTVNAPRELVWKAWTEQDRLQQWFGPKGSKTIYSKYELRPGGVAHYQVRGADGDVKWGRCVYREVVKPERLVWVQSFSDETGGLTRLPILPQFPAEMLSTVTLEEVGKRTRITVSWLPINATDEEKKFFAGFHESMTGGWSGSFEQLDQYVAESASDAHEVNITRFVNAPRALVFDAWTDAKHLAKWWGPRGFTTSRCEADPRPGGALRIDMRGPDGTIYPSKGTYKEFLRPDRIVFTLDARDDKGNVVLDTLATVTFEERGETTVVNVNARVTHAEPAAAPYIAGMKQGWTETVDCFEEYVTRS